MEWSPFNGSPHPYPRSRPQTPISPTFGDDGTIALATTSLEGVADTAPSFHWNQEFTLFPPGLPTHVPNLDIPVLSERPSQLPRPADPTPISKDRLLIASGNFISNVHDLNQFQSRENGFSPATGGLGSQGSRSPNQRYGRGRRPSHSATSVTTNRPSHCPCPFGECQTVREHMSHIVNHLIQKHGFRREYLKSVQDTTKKRKKECVIVNYQLEYAFCNWCWATFQTRDGIDQHINQSSRCPNRQNSSKDQKQHILQTMLDGSVSQSSHQFPSETSQSIPDSATAPTELGSLGVHLFGFEIGPSQNLNYAYDGSVGMSFNYPLPVPDLANDDKMIPDITLTCEWEFDLENQDGSET